MRIQKSLARIHLAMNSDRGATAVEYGLIVTLIALAIIIAVTAVGGQLNTVYNNVVTGLGG